MINFNDVINANNLLISLGGEDQMPRIMPAIVNRSLELEFRLDRALKYAAAAPSNSLHARNMARILDGSITVEDELHEKEFVVPESKALSQQKVSRKPRASGLIGRSMKERKEFRDWVQEQKLDLPKYGPIKQVYVDAFDASKR